MRKNNTPMTEHEVAAWLEVAPVFILSWIEEQSLVADTDELGYTLTNLQVALFEDEYTATIEAARSLTAATVKIGVARATLRRDERTRRAAGGDESDAS